MPTTTSPSNTFTQRLIGAMALDVAIYEEVEADASATGQALAVVVLSSLAAGIGSRGLGGTSWGTIVFIATVSLIAWATWALVVFEVGGRILPEPQTRVDVGQLLRTIGFASAPGMLRVLGVMSAATIPVFVVTSIWMLIAMIVGVRQALDYQSTARAIAVCVLGWTLAIVIAVALGLFLGPTVS
jgi:predicted neutral ceramidase superfamily lipid hydrolase